MSKKPWYEKVGIWVTIVAGICTITGYSLFDNKYIIKQDKDIKYDLSQLNEEIKYPILTEEEKYWDNYTFEIPEETNYKNMKSLNCYVRLKEDYGKIFAAPTCLYTNIEQNIGQMILTGNDGSQFSYSIHDLILEPPYITPKWTKEDIMQYITEFTNGTIENIEIVNFSTTKTNFYVKGIDSKNKDMLIYLMVALQNTIYRSLEIKIPYYNNYEDEVSKEYYMECIYRLSDFMDASEEVRTFQEFYKYYKYH